MYYFLLQIPRFILFLKIRAISSEQDRLVNTSSHIVKELNTNTKASMEQVLQAYVINDGMIRIIDSANKPIIQQTTTEGTDYRNIISTYNNNQFEEVVSYKDSNFVMVSIPTIYENGEIVNLQVFENVGRTLWKYRRFKMGHHIRNEYCHYYIICNEWIFRSGDFTTYTTPY